MIRARSSTPRSALRHPRLPRRLPSRRAPRHRGRPAQRRGPRRRRHQCPGAGHRHRPAPGGDPLRLSGFHRQHLAADGPGRPHDRGRPGPVRGHRRRARPVRAPAPRIPLRALARTGADQPGQPGAAHGPRALRRVRAALSGGRSVRRLPGDGGRAAGAGGGGRPPPPRRGLLLERGELSCAARQPAQRRGRRRGDPGRSAAGQAPAHPPSSARWTSPARPSWSHDGAIYLHEGQSYLVERLDLEQRRADVVPVAVDYYTAATSETDVQVLAVHDSRTVRTHARRPSGT